MGEELRGRGSGARADLGARGRGQMLGLGGGGLIGRVGELAAGTNLSRSSAAKDRGKKGGGAVHSWKGLRERRAC